MNPAAQNQVRCPKCGWIQPAFSPVLTFGYNAPVFRCARNKCPERFVVVLFATENPRAVHLIRVLHLPSPRPAIYDQVIHQVQDLTPEDRTALSTMYRLATAVWTERTERPEAAPAA